MTDSQFRKWQRICRIDAAARTADRQGRTELADRLWGRANRALAAWTAAR